MLRSYILYAMLKLIIFHLRPRHFWYFISSVIRHQYTICIFFDELDLLGSFRLWSCYIHADKKVVELAASYVVINIILILTSFCFVVCCRYTRHCLQVDTPNNFVSIRLDAYLDRALVMIAFKSLKFSSVVAEYWCWILDNTQLLWLTYGFHRCAQAYHIGLMWRIRLALSFPMIVTPHDLQRVL